MTKKYESYFPEPVNGQAILSNFNRVLTYKGSNDLGSRLVRGMPLYEASLLETIGDQNNGNYVFRGDCVSTCAYLKNNGIFVDLVYIDPPFASGADYAKTVFLRQNPKIAKAFEDVGKELDIDDLKTFEEKMYGDIWDKEKYLSWMYENLLAIRSVMNVKASIYVHLDWHIVHYVKIIMDEIFGEENFRNEIVWCYKTSLKASDTAFGRDHDTILFYANSEDVHIHPDKSDFPSSESTIKRWAKYADETGFVSNKHFAGSDSTIIDTSDETKGFCIYNGIPRDWWEISSNVSKGNTDEVISGKYSTQKPEALLERIIKASSDKEMIVADFFGGSGVAATVASKLDRRFIHSDININSIQTARDRLLANKASFDVFEIQDGVSLYRNPVQTMNKLKSMILGLKNEDRLDKFWEGAINDPKNGLVPVYVPNLLDSSTRILDDVLMRRILHEAMPDLDISIKKVIIYYIDIENKIAIDNLIKDDVENNIEIEFRDLKEILDDIIVEDTIDFSLVENKEKLSGYIIDINAFYSDTVNRRITSFNLKSAQNDKKGTFKPIVVSESGLELIELVSVDWTNDGGPWHSDYEIKIGIDSNIIENGVKTKSKWDGKIHSEKKPLRIKVRNICGDETIFTV